MGQRPIGVRVKTSSPDGPDADPSASLPSVSRAEEAIVSVGEAARKLGVSERTIFRLLKTGVLERVDLPLVPRNVFFYDSTMTDIKTDNTVFDGLKLPVSKAGKSDVSHVYDKSKAGQTESLLLQVREKDAQITHLLRTQQDMAQTIQRLQEQMYELAHLVLSHNAAAAQARAEAELKAQEQALAASRRGLSNLLGTRKRA